MTLKNLIDRIFDNWAAKVVCFALAFLLFIFYRMSTLEMRYFSVPLIVENSDSFVPSSAYPRTVKITLRGENESIYPVLETDIIAYIDLGRTSREGEFRIPVQTRLKGTAAGSTMIEVSVEPGELLLHLEHRISRRIPVDPVFRGEPEAGFEAGSFSVMPSYVEISGPRSFVEKTQSIRTDAVDLSGVNGPVTSEVLLAESDPLIFVEGSPKITVNIAITEKILIRQFLDIPIFFENLNPSLEVQTANKTGSLSIKGSEASLSQWVLTENALSVFCENIGSPGIYSLPVHAIVPGRFEIAEVSPLDIQFTVTRKIQ